MYSWWWTGGVRWWKGARFDPSGPHVGQELIGDFGKYFFSQSSHAEDVVSSPVNVVSERNKLRKRGEETRREGDCLKYLARASEKEQNEKDTEEKVDIY